MSNLGGKKMSEDTDKDSQITSVVAGARISVDNTDPTAPVVTADIQAGGQVDSVVGGTNCSVDATDPVNPIVNVTAHGQVDSVVGGTNCSVDATDPVNPIVNADTQTTNTTKGDLEGFSTVAARIPVGTNAQVLTADSGEALGVKWATPAAGGGDVATDVIFDAKGDLPGGTGADTSARLAVGTNDQVLTADSAEATGMKWTTPAAGGGAISAGRVVRTSGVAVSGATLQALVWQTEDYDDDTFVDLGTDDDRLTVPTGVTRVNVMVFLGMSGMTAGGRQNLSIRRYSAADALIEIVGNTEISAEDTTGALSVTALGVTCVAGEYFEANHFFDDSSWTFDKGNFCIQDVSP